MCNHNYRVAGIISWYHILVHCTSLYSCGVVLCGIVGGGMVWYGIVWCGVVLCGGDVYIRMCVCVFVNL